MNPIPGGESSDNDSSTYYGQLKTFESVFESEASPVAEMQVGRHNWDEISRRYAKSTKSYDNIGTLF